MKVPMLATNRAATAMLPLKFNRAPMNSKAITEQISSDGVIVIKAQQYRTQEKNRADALERLKALILDAIAVEKTRRQTKPTLGSKQRRLEGKSLRGSIKATRGKVDY